MDRRSISSPLVPSAHPPISQAIRVGDLVFTSMTPPWRLDYTLDQGNFAAQMRQSMDNLIHVLEAAGSSLALAVRINITLARIQDAAEMNEIYTEYVQRYFPSGGYPARSSVEGRMGRKEFLVEIECIAVVGKLNNTHAPEHARG